MTAKTPKTQSNTWKIVFYLITSTIIIFILIGASNIVDKYPINSSRDWLSILADFGQFFGGLAIIGIIVEVSRYLKTEREEAAKRIPKIHISRTITISNAVDEFGMCSLIELDRPQIQDPQDQYREMWIEMGAPKNNGTDRYIRVDIVNNQVYTEANIEEFKLKITLTYTGSNPRQNSTTKTFWCPIDELPIQIGKKVSLYIRCGMLNDPNIISVGGKILDYMCVTAKRDKYYGKAIGFREITIPFQPLNPGIS
jgi:hypothetical protein